MLKASYNARKHVKHLDFPNNLIIFATSKGYLWLSGENPERASRIRHYPFYY